MTLELDELDLFGVHWVSQRTGETAAVETVKRPGRPRFRSVARCTYEHVVAVKLEHRQATLRSAARPILAELLPSSEHGAVQAKRTPLNVARNHLVDRVDPALNPGRPKPRDVRHIGGALRSTRVAGTCLIGRKYGRLRSWDVPSDDRVAVRVVGQA